MATSVTYNGNSYSVPAYNDTGYAQGSGNMSSYLIALATGSLTLAGGTFTLTADANFGGSFGLVALYMKSVSSNIATAGFIRMSNTDLIEWRNAAFTGNNTFGVDTSNQLVYNGTVIAGATGIVPVTAGGTGRATLTSGSYLKGNGTGTVNFQAAPIPIADGGTNSIASLNNNRIMKSSGGTIIEAAAIAASAALISDANGIPIAMNANAAMGGFKFTGSAAATANGDLVRFEQISGLRVLSIIEGTTTSSATSSSSTYATTNLSQAIVPASSASKIHVRAILPVRAIFSGSVTTTVIAGLRIKRDSTVIRTWDQAVAYRDTANAAVTGFTEFLIPIEVYDSPATGSSVTYSVEFNSSGGGSVLIDNTATNPSLITLEDIG